MAAGDSKSPGNDKRRRILDAALAVSQERGVHAARMEEVAARAQVSKGTLYRFFESKEDLFLEMMIDSYLLGRRAREAAEAAAPAEQGAAEVLHQRLHGLATVLDVVAPRARVHYQSFGVVGDAPEASARLNQFLAGFHRERHAHYEELVRAGQLEGSFRSDADPDTVAHIIDSLLSGFIYRAAFDPVSATPEALVRCFEAIFRDVLGFRAEKRAPAEDAGA